MAEFVTDLSTAANLRSYQSFKTSPYACHKHTTYFDVYDQLFSSYRGKKITFVEIGVLEGGSLFMWRDFFGPQARIIGVDLNPGVSKWKDHGFEIFIGNQSDQEFWKNFINTVGEIDIVMDDGGHTFDQQIITCESLLPHINDGGLLVVEDTHTSYMSGFGNKKYSFIEYTKLMIDRINNRFENFANRPREQRVWSLRFFESFVVFEINRPATHVMSKNIHNDHADQGAVDFRHSDGKLLSFIDARRKHFSFLKNIPGMSMLLRLAYRVALALKEMKATSRTKRFFSV
jgi:hypothetical protein